MRAEVTGYGQQFKQLGFGMALLATAFTAGAVAADPAPDAPDWLELGLGLFGGLALFLYGMDRIVCTYWMFCSVPTGIT